MMKRLHWFVPALFVIWMIVGLIPGPGRSGVGVFGEIPVMQKGRVKPLDAVARNALLLIRGKQSVRIEGQHMSATQWLLELISKPELTDTYPIFLVDNPDLKMFLGLNLEQKVYSFNELKSNLQKIVEHSAVIHQYEKNLWSPYQKALSLLNDRLTIYFRLKHTFFVPQSGPFTDQVKADLTFVEEAIESVQSHPDAKILTDETKVTLKRFNRFLGQSQFQDQVAYMWVLPPSYHGSETHPWMNHGRAFLHYIESRSIHPGVLNFAAVLDAYAAGEMAVFKARCRDVLALHHQIAPENVWRAKFESIFNHFQPFYKSLLVYLMSFIFIMGSWMGQGQPLRKTAIRLLILAFLVHTLGLIMRMWLQGRPPVTNLYSSAVFVGWVAIVLGICLEKLYKNRIGIMVASVIGFLTLIIAHHLSLQGDTLEMMQAVLDSNFWLSTHVVTITMGYGSMFLAGTLALIYVVQGFFTKKLSAHLQSDLARMVFGIVCFSLLFSFVGTVLGGIWADQSWGRFWGWDPKENGALLIVLWCVVTVHVRKERLIKDRGLMLMAIFGSIITSFSWFGVNMLGIGLHSYGFMDSAFFWLAGFMISQLVFIAIGALPKRYWKSRLR